VGGCGCGCGGEGGACLWRPGTSDFLRHTEAEQLIKQPLLLISCPLPPESTSWMRNGQAPLQGANRPPLHSTLALRSVS
jgi:hypothetical protein